jgi:hypothetical protein
MQTGAKIGGLGPLTTVLYALHLCFLAFLPGATNATLIPRLDSALEYTALAILGFLGIPLWAGFTLTSSQFPSHLGPALVRTLLVPASFLVWWLLSGGSWLRLLEVAFVVEWMALLLAMLIVGIGPARWMSKNLLDANPTPGGRAGYMARAAAAGLIFGAMLADVLYLYRETLMGLSTVAVAMLTALIAAEAISAASAMSRHEDRPLQGIVGPALLLIVSFFFWLASAAYFSA